MTNDGRPAIRVVVAEDDDFTRSLVADGLRAEGFPTKPGSWSNRARTFSSATSTSDRGSRQGHSCAA